MPLHRISRLSLSLFVALLLTTMAFAQTPSFSHLTYPGAVSAHADFNQDGREDFLEISGNSGNQVTIMKSTGDAVYTEGVTYVLPTSASINTIAVGDFNGDGKADFVLTTNSRTLYLYTGKGDGTFYLHSITLPNAAATVVAGDFNHDRKMDLAYATTSGTQIQVMFGNNNSTFTTGPLTSVPSTEQLQLGDFDGDGKADLYAQNCGPACGVGYVYYGDGTGHFPTQVNAGATSGGHGAYSYVVDLDGDGKSDLVGAVSVYSTNASCQYVPTVYVYYGNSSRTWTETSISTTKVALQAGYDVADVNGDGVPDLVFEQSDDCNGYYTQDISVLTGKGSRTFNPEQTIYSSSNPNLWSPQVVRADRNTKPDVVVNDFGSPSTTFVILQNLTSATKFPSCTAPNAYEGINVCSPGTSSTSPVSFRIGAAGQTPMHRVEVWVDGVKKLQNLYGYSRYAFLDGSLSLANGSHRITVFAAGWDNWLEKKTLTLTVGSSTCAAPSTSTGVVICSPAAASTVSNPVSITAKGGTAVTSIEAWIDGVKKGQQSGTSLNLSLTLSSGTHKLTVFSKVNGSVGASQSETFTVN